MQRIIISTLFVIVATGYPLANAENLQISPEEAESFNNEKSKPAVDAANEKMNQDPNHVAKEEVDRQERGTGEIFNTIMQQ